MYCIELCNTSQYVRYRLITKIMMSKVSTNLCKNWVQNVNKVTRLLLLVRQDLLSNEPPNTFFLLKYVCVFYRYAWEVFIYIYAEGEARSGIAVDSTPPKVVLKPAIWRERSSRLNPWYGVTTKFYPNFVSPNQNPSCRRVCSLYEGYCRFNIPVWYYYSLSH